MKLVFDEKALVDLEGIYNWIAKDNPTAAMAVVERVFASTFSDNVVITQPVCAETVTLIAHMAINQVASALKGYLLRGGITIGDVVHDEEAVFGPGLNRAYELESEVARFPRFVVDSKIVRELGNLGDLPIEEEGVIFLDPFRLEFIQYIRDGEMAVSRETLHDAGLPYPKNTAFDLWNDQVLRLMLDSLKPQIRAPIPDEAWEKVAWLYDRLASQIGVPLGSFLSSSETGRRGELTRRFSKIVHRVNRARSMELPA